MTGAMHRDGRLKVGWFHQHQIEALDPTDTPLEIIRRADNINVHVVPDQLSRAMKGRISRLPGIDRRAIRTSAYAGSLGMVGIALLLGLALRQVHITNVALVFLTAVLASGGNLPPWVRQDRSRSTCAF